MVESSIRNLTCLNPQGSHQISYQLWGTPSSTEPPIICVHGLTRNSHDFDLMAAALSTDNQVICPDIIGRGNSDRLPNPSHYDYTQYVADMGKLISITEKNQVNWIGTSMGGLIGMMLASSPLKPIRKLIINDIGPHLEASALERIATYVGKSPIFKDLQEVETYLRKVHSPFDPMTDQNWQDMAKYSSFKTGPDSFELNYDRKIGENLRKNLTGKDVDLWPIWNLITCPTLVIRGKKSDLLSKETADKMRTTGPKATIVEYEDAGHAPSLMSKGEIEMIKNWLNETP